MDRSGLCRFPEGFLWGAATSAYQIEGAAKADGKGPSIWDTFCKVPGAIERGESGAVASDHYHRLEEDLDLMAALGLGAYRFSVAWTRIQPNGEGPALPAGLAFYERLVDGLLQRGIEPLLTLYHWDLPQALQDRGGWTARDTALRFADYAGLVAARLGDRVTRWITHNEPMVVAAVGHLTGEHAPGVRDLGTSLSVLHTLLLSHGLGLQALRAAAPQPIEIGIALNLSPVHPASDSPDDLEAAARYDVFLNRLTLDPLFHGRYPEEMEALFGPVAPTPAAEDLEALAAPIDFLGINYYNRTVVRADPQGLLIGASPVRPSGREYSQMWEIYPEGLYELLTRLDRDHLAARPGLPILVTENGIAVPDGLDADGRCRDERRIRFLRDHLTQAHRALVQGVRVQGYFAWSLLDNFEWALGYRARFGLIYVDFETQQRTIKDSGRWYARVIEASAVDPQAPERLAAP